MRRIVFKVIFPLVLIGLWLFMWYPVCRVGNEFDFLLYWVLVGFPFGIRKMCMILIPKNFRMTGGVGVLAVNVIVGGLIGGGILTVTLIRIVGILVKIVSRI